jgi:peptidoglycan/LPS O-acetylase OafA/YrhL
LIAVWRCILVFGLNAIEDRTYMGSDTRFDSIFFGCALAIGANPMLDPPRVSERIWKWLVMPAALIVLFITFQYRAPWFRETIRYSLQGIALTPVFITAMRFPGWLPYRLANIRLIAFVGVLSYVLYLVHQVILFAVGYQLPSLHAVPRAVLALLLSLVIAVAIHHFVEKPCARMRRRLTEVPTSG